MAKFIYGNLHVPLLHRPPLHVWKSLPPQQPLATGIYIVLPLWTMQCAEHICTHMRKKSLRSPPNACAHRGTAGAMESWMWPIKGTCRERGKGVVEASIVRASTGVCLKFRFADGMRVWAADAGTSGPSTVSTFSFSGI